MLLNNFVQRSIVRTSTQHVRPRINSFPPTTSQCQPAESRCRAFSSASDTTAASTNTDSSANDGNSSSSENNSFTINSRAFFSRANAAANEYFAFRALKKVGMFALTGWTFYETGNFLLRNLFVRTDDQAGDDEGESGNIDESGDSVTWEQKFSLYFGLSRQERAIRATKQQILHQKMTKLINEKRKQGVMPSKADAEMLYYENMYPNSGITAEKWKDRFATYGNCVFSDPVLRTIGHLARKSREKKQSQNASNSTKKVHNSDSTDLEKPVILEVMAGTGKWAEALQEKENITVFASDSNASGRLTSDKSQHNFTYCRTPSNSSPGMIGVVSDKDESCKKSSSSASKPDNSSEDCEDTCADVDFSVEILDAQKAISKYQADTDLLLLVFPPPGPAARAALEQYTGEYFVYVGEGDGGVNADAAFFKYLEKNFKLFKVMDLPEVLPDSFERAYFLKQRRNNVEG